VTEAVKPRVLVVHNRYRTVGGEERSVELQLQALAAAGIEHRLLERRSSEAGRGRAAAALLRGGERADELAGAVRDLRADVVHAHNTLPLIGPRSLAAARAAGASVVLHLHNVRLFCATGFGERDGGPCFRCHHRLTLPGLVLNCRRSLPEALVYAMALSAHQPAMVAAVDRFVAPSAWAAGQVAKLGLPRERVDVLMHYLPPAAFARRSQAAQGRYAFVAARLSPEKGVDDAIVACSERAIPLRVAGEGPERARLEDLAGRLRADVAFLGRIPAERVRAELSGAAMVAMPSHYHEFAPFSALEAMAQGVPVVATAMGGLPELLGRGAAVAPGDRSALGARLEALWRDPGARAAEGEALIARTRERHSQERYLRDLLSLYERLPAAIS
jgi:glycosyltransferase involved in cell wall biosynthesis